MAVARLSQRWVLAVLLGEYPDGVARGELLKYFTTRLVTQRSSAGAAGRLARKLYKILMLLGRRGLVSQEEGQVRPLATLPQATGKPEVPILDRALEKLLFNALMAEDRSDAPGGPTRLHEARKAFILAALEAGWDEHQIGAALGLSPGKLRLAFAPLP